MISTTPPVITLTGAAKIRLEARVDPYTEQGTTADDNVDGAFPTTAGGNTVDADTVGVYVDFQSISRSNLDLDYDKI